MNPSCLLASLLLALVSVGVSIPRVQAQQDALPDYIPVQGGDGGNDRWDYLYWSPSTGAMVPDWNADNWSRFYGYEFTRGNPFPPARYPTELRNEAIYAVFWDSANTGPASGFKTVDLDADMTLRGLHFRNQGWQLQDADQANTLTLISGAARPYHMEYSDDREAITMDTDSQAAISVNLILGAFLGSTWTSTGSTQYISMGTNSALTITGNISQTGVAKTLSIGRNDFRAGTGSVLTLAGNNSFTGGVIFYTSATAAYGSTSTPRLNLNHNQALGTGPFTILGGLAILGNTSGSAVTITNQLVLSNTTAGTSGNFYNSNLVVADTESLVYQSAHDLTLTSDLTLTTHRSIRVEADGGDLVLSGRVLSDGSTTSSFFKNGPGTLVLSGTDSTYTGVTQINGGVLEVTHLANAGQASSIGASANTVARNLAGIFGANVSTSGTTNSTAADAPLPSLILGNGGTLRYVGTGDSTDRLIGLLPGRRAPSDLVTTAVSIEASGSGALKFTNTGDVIHIHNYADLFRILNLTGTNTDDNTFNLALTDVTSSAGLVRNQLTKTGSGTWILSGDNSYTGGTTVEDGKLILTGANTGTGEIRVNGGILLVDGDNSGAIGAILLADSGKLGGSGTIGGSVHFGLGAGIIFDPTKTLTINGATVTFDGFGMADVIGLNSSIALGTYTLLDGSATMDFTNVGNYGIENAYALGDGKYAYFQSGSLNVLIVPEPSTGVLIGFGAGFLAWRRRRR